MKEVLFCITILILAVGNAFSQIDYYSFNTNNFREFAAFHDTIDLKNPDIQRLNAVVFFLTNEQRAKKKLPVLQYHPLLEKAANIHSESMREKDFFDHINRRSKNLHDPNDRARYVGIENPFLAENIIESFVLKYKAGEPVYPGSPGVFRISPDSEPIQAHTYLSLGESMISDYMNSQKHRENILSKKAEQLGVGSAFYRKKDFNDMPAVLSTQNFQLHEKIRVME